LGEGRLLGLLTFDLMRIEPVRGKKSEGMGPYKKDFEVLQQLGKKKKTREEEIISLNRANRTLRKGVVVLNPRTS